MRRAWAVAWRNLRRNRRRNIATATAIAMGYAGLVVLGGYSSRVENFLRTSAVYLQHSGHVTVYLEGGFHKASAEPERYQLDAAAQQKILALAATDDRIEFAGRYLRGVGLAGNGCATQPALVLGVEPSVLARTTRHPQVALWCPELGVPVKGRWMDAFPDLPNAAAVSVGLAILLQKSRVHDEAVGLEPAPTLLHCETPLEKDELGRDANVQLVSLTYDGMSNAVDAEMVATFHAAEPVAEDGSMIASLASLQTLYATDRVTYIALFLHDARQASAVATDLQRALAADGVKVEALPYDDERTNPYYVGTMAFLGSMVGFITLLVALVLMLTVLGAMTLTILERTREIGTWRALGFTRRHVTGLVVREAMLLAITGLVGGLVVGLGASLAINSANIRFEPPGIPGTIQLIIQPVATMCLVQAALVVPAVCLAAWLVVRGQVKRNLVDLLTSQTG
jgi:putative ABC transport system permease protein